MARELQSLEFQLASFKDPASDRNFRRAALVHSFTDLVNSIHTRENFTDRHLRALEKLSYLQAVDKNFFSDCGIDLLEPVIRLQIICRGDFLPQLASLSNCLASQADPKELLSELNLVIDCLLGTEKHPLEKIATEMLIEDSGGLDIFKSVVSMYVPHILTNLLPKDLTRELENLDKYLNYIMRDIEIFHICLGGPAWAEILEIVRNRKMALKFNSFYECLNFLLKVLKIYEASQKFFVIKMEVVESIEELYGDFMSIFYYWRKETGDELTEGVGFLAEYACEGYPESLEIPLVYSGIFRLEVLLPVGALVSDKQPQVFYTLFQHSLEFLDRKFKYEHDPVLQYRKLTVNKFFELILDCIARGEILDLLKLFEELLNNYSKGIRCILLEKLIFSYSRDKCRALLIDFYTANILKYWESQAIETLKVILNFEPIMEYTDSLLSSLKLYRFLALSGNNEEELKEIYSFTIVPLYNELSIAYDYEHAIPEIELLIWTIQEIQEII